MEWLSLVITLLTAVAASGVAIWQVRTQRVRQVEDFYIARYWSLLDRLSTRTLRGVDAGALDEEEEMPIRLYFRLSEDEADSGLKAGSRTTLGVTGAAPSTHRCIVRRSTVSGPRPAGIRMLGATTSSGICANFGSTPPMTRRQLAPAASGCAELRGEGPRQDTDHRRREVNHTTSAPDWAGNHGESDGAQRGHNPTVHPGQQPSQPQDRSFPS